MIWLSFPFLFISLFESGFTLLAASLILENNAYRHIYRPSSSRLTGYFTARGPFYQSMETGKYTIIGIAFRLYIYDGFEIQAHMDALIIGFRRFRILAFLSLIKMRSGNGSARCRQKASPDNISTTTRHRVSSSAAMLNEQWQVCKGQYYEAFTSWFLLFQDGWYCLIGDDFRLFRGWYFHIGGECRFCRHYLSSRASATRIISSMGRFRLASATCPRSRHWWHINAVMISPPSRLRIQRALPSFWLLMADEILLLFISQKRWWIALIL